VCNKVLIGLDIMIEFREYFKDGVPLSNIINRKLKALLLKTEQACGGLHGHEWPDTQQRKLIGEFVQSL